MTTQKQPTQMVTGKMVDIVIETTSKCPTKESIEMGEKLSDFFKKLEK